MTCHKILEICMEFIPAVEKYFQMSPCCLLVDPGLKLVVEAVCFLKSKASCTEREREKL